MAKTKKTISLDNGGDSFIQSIQKDINDAMGKLVAYNLDTEDPLEVKQWFSTGSDLIDLICRGEFGEGDQKGGIPSGRILMINGESGSGKSLLLWHIIKDVIDKGGVAMYLDTEGATNLSFPKMIGVDTSKVIFIPPESCETVETTFSIVDKFFNSLIKSKNPNRFGIIGIDSVTTLSTGDEMDEEGLQTRAYPTKARMMSKIMRKWKGLIPQTNVCLCLTNQLRTDIGDTSFFGDKMTVPTGIAQFFTASTVLRLYKSSKIKGDSSGNILGQVIRVKTEKSRFTRPYREVKIPLHFEQGLLNEISIYDKLDEMKVFNGKTKAKKWIENWEGLEGAVLEDDKWILKFAQKDWTNLYKTNKDLKNWCQLKLKEEFMKPAASWDAEGTTMIDYSNESESEENGTNDESEE